MGIMLSKRGDETRKQIMECIATFIDNNGYSPTIRELCELTGLKSTSTVHTHLVRLQSDGLITFEMDRPRTIRVIKNTKECKA